MHGAGEEKQQEEAKKLKKSDKIKCRKYIPFEEIDSKRIKLCIQSFDLVQNNKSSQTNSNFGKCSISSQTEDISSLFEDFHSFGVGSELCPQTKFFVKKIVDYFQNFYYGISAHRSPVQSIYLKRLLIKL